MFRFWYPQRLLRRRYLTSRQVDGPETSSER